MQETFGNEIAKHRQAFVQMTSPFTQPPKKQENWQLQPTTLEQPEILRYQASLK